MSETGTKADASLRPASHTLGDLVDEMAARRPAAEAIVFREERLDYAALKARADAFARALLAVGVQQGDRVALLVTNRPEWIICSLAAAKIGAIVAAISTFSAPRELAWALEHCGAVAMITLEAFRGRRFLDALRVLYPELGDAQPGALKSAQLLDCRLAMWERGMRLFASVHSSSPPAFAEANPRAGAGSECRLSGRSRMGLAESPRSRLRSAEPGMAMKSATSLSPESGSTACSPSPMRGSCLACKRATDWLAASKVLQATSYPQAAD